MEKSTTMPARKTYKKKSRKRHASKSHKKYGKKSRASRYVSPRALAIQRADLMPQTKLVEFVMDETFYLCPNATTKASNAHGLYLQLGTPFAPYNTSGGPYWGGSDFTKNARLSGIDTAWADWNMPGSGRWVGAHPSPYKGGTVIGFDVEIRAEQATRSVTQETATPIPDMVRSIAFCAKLSTDTGTVDKSTTNEATLHQWQGTRKHRQVNMTVDSGTLSVGSGPAKNNAQQGYIRLKGSAKKMFGFNDYKDVYNKYGFITDKSGGSASISGPEQQPYLHIGFFDRFQSINNNTSTAYPNLPYVMPDMAVRVKHKIIVLCRNPNNLVNIDAAGSAPMDAGGDGGD